MQDEAERIAKGLSAAQKASAMSTWDGDYRMSGILTSLAELGLYRELRLGDRHLKVRHTTLGLAVRQYLSKEADDGE